METGEIRRRIIQTDKSPAPIGPFSQAVAVGNTIYLSGQLGADPATGKLVEGGVEAETHQIFKNIISVLKADGLSLKNVVKCTVLLASMEDFQKINAVYAQYFTEKYPARKCFQVACLPMNGNIEIECVAIKNLID